MPVVYYLCKAMVNRSSTVRVKNVFFSHFGEAAKDVESLIHNLQEVRTGNNLRDSLWGPICHAGWRMFKNWLSNHPFCVAFVAKCFPEVSVILLNHLSEGLEGILSVLASLFHCGANVGLILFTSDSPSSSELEVAHRLFGTIVAQMTASENITEMSTIFCSFLAQMPHCFFSSTTGNNEDKRERVITSFLENEKHWNYLFSSWNEDDFFCWVKIFYQCARLLILSSAMISSRKKKQKRSPIVKPILSKKMLDGVGSAIQKIHLLCFVQESDEKKIVALLVLLSVFFLHFSHGRTEEQQLRELAKEVAATGAGSPKSLSLPSSVGRCCVLQILYNEVFSFLTENSESGKFSSHTVQGEKRDSFVASIQKENKNVILKNDFCALSSLAATISKAFTSASSLSTWSSTSSSLLDLQESGIGAFVALLFPTVIPYLVKLGMELVEMEKVPESLSSINNNSHEISNIEDNLIDALNWILLGNNLTEATDASSSFQFSGMTSSDYVKMIFTLYDPVELFLFSGGEEMLLRFLNGSLSLKNGACRILLQVFFRPASSAHQLGMAVSERHCLVLLSSPLLSVLEAQLQGVAEAEDTMQLVEAEPSRVVLIHMLSLITSLTPVALIDVFTPSIIIPSIASIISQSLLIPPSLTEHAFASLAMFAKKYPFPAASILDFEFITEQFSLNETPPEPNMRIIIGSFEIMEALAKSSPVVVTFEWLEILAKGIELLPLYTPLFPLFQMALWRCTQAVLENVDEDAVSTFCSLYTAHHVAKAFEELLKYTKVKEMENKNVLESSSSTADNDQKAQELAKVTTLLPVVLNVAARMRVKDGILEAALRCIPLKGDSFVKTIVTPELLVQIAYYYSMTKPQMYCAAERGENSTTTLQAQEITADFQIKSEYLENPIKLLLDLWVQLADKEETTLELSLKSHSKELNCIAKYLTDGSFEEEIISALLQSVQDAALSDRHVPELLVYDHHKIIRKSFVAASLLRHLVPLLKKGTAVSRTSTDYPKGGDDLICCSSELGAEIIQTMEEVSSKIIISAFQCEEKLKTNLKRSEYDPECTWRASVLHEMIPMLSLVLADSHCYQTKALPLTTLIEKAEECPALSSSSIIESEEKSAKHCPTRFSTMANHLLHSSLFTKMMRVVLERSSAGAFLSPSADQTQYEEEAVLIFDSVRRAIVHSEYEFKELVNANNLLCFVDEFLLQPSLLFSSKVTSAAYELLKVLLSCENLRMHLFSSHSSLTNEKQKIALSFFLELEKDKSS